MKRLIPLLLLTALLTACGPSRQLTRESQYGAMYQNMPVTLLVMPPINNTTNVEAKELLYTSISQPLAEAGYYVISPNLAMDILKAESAYDAELFVDKPLRLFKEYFGADAVVFSQIDDWTKRGFGIATKIRYFIKSTTNNEIIFDRTCDLYLDLQENTSGNSGWSALIGLAVSALNTALTDHIVAARKVNGFVFEDIPRGKYSPDYLKDGEITVEPKDIKKTVK